MEESAHLQLHRGGALSQSDELVPVRTSGKYPSDEDSQEEQSKCYNL